MTADSRDARLLRAVLGQTGPVEVTVRQLDDWLDHARTQRCIPLLQLAVQRDTDDLDAHRRLNVEQLAVCGAMVQMETDALPVLDALTSAGVPYALLKGASVAHLDSPDPSWRQFGDIDLLVDPSSVATARSMLDGLGWRQAYPLPARHLVHTHAITFRSSGPTEIDLHQCIGRRALGLLVPTADLLASREPFELAGRTVCGLSAPDRLVHAAVHMVASRGEYRRLSSVADVLLLSYLGEDTAGQIVERACRFGVDRLLDTAVRSAWERAQLPLPDGWVAALAAAPHRTARLVAYAYTGERRRPVAEELAYLRLLPGTRARVGYLWGYLTPGSGYRERNDRRGVFAQLKYLASRTRQR